MDRVTLQSELASQQATYDGAKAEFEYQKKNYERSKGLHDKSLISDTDYEQALYNYQKAKSAFDSSKASLAKAERNLSYATITSPIDGVVISRDVEAGQTVASGFETPTLFTIAADLTQMQVVADVDEADIGGIEEGQRASFTVDAYPNDTFEGVVTQIRLGDASSTSSTSSSTSTVVTYEVVISAHNPDLKLKPRLTANITIYILDKKDVLSVPNKALRFTPEEPLIGKNDIVKDCESEHKVWTREGTTFTAHPVEIGITNGISTEIISGVAEGTRVVTEATIGGIPGESMEAPDRSGRAEKEVRSCRALREATKIRDSLRHERNYHIRQYKTRLPRRRRDRPCPARRVVHDSRGGVRYDHGNLRLRKEYHLQFGCPVL